MPFTVSKYVMNSMTRSLDGLEVLLAAQPIDLPRIQTILRTIREQCNKMNVSQQELIEANQALIQRVLELEKHEKK
jgi:flagellar biosynthesis/type III secretory pathway chaperone